MERYICIHGHFYQPPRENPWLEAIELQDTAYPYHDWNERITAECYAANAASRILDEKGRIVRILDNYAKISFDIGPTLLSWMERNSPDLYQSILESDRKTQKAFGGHGSALAQVYNHVILPLANRRDKVTQVLWGIRDFEHRFKRKPEGMWLPETAVDNETLELLAEQGIRFAILAPHQAKRIGSPKDKLWRDADAGSVDPTMAYRLKLPSGRTMSVFFYDGPISRAVAFEGLLSNGEVFAKRLVGRFSEKSDRPQLVHIATDGESYGHHHRFGDMALAYALNTIESRGLARLTNYGEYLEKNPPVFEAEICENTSWSCGHGVKRWQADCGCSTGANPKWNQAWRVPLREALDWLRDTLAPAYERHGGTLFKDPWEARNEYIDVLVDRTPENEERFFERQASHSLNEEEKMTALKLLELQRHALLMYTSCGWFFDDISGIETVQVLQYAGRVIQVAQDVFGDAIESRFLEILEKAKSNIPEKGDGRQIYETSVRTSIVDLPKVAAHFAVSSLFEEYSEQERVYCIAVELEDYKTSQAGRAKLALGRVKLTSEITRKWSVLCFGVLHLGDHNINCGVMEYKSPEAYSNLVKEISRAFAKADFPMTIRLLDKHFGQPTYSLASLFRDKQRKILDLILEPTLKDAETKYRELYEYHVPLMHFLKDSGLPLPKTLAVAAEFVLNAGVRRAFEDLEFELEHVSALLDEARVQGITLDAATLEFALRGNIELMVEWLRSNPTDVPLLEKLEKAAVLARSLPFDVNLWKAQNICYSILQHTYPDFQRKAEQGDGEAEEWLSHFRLLAEKLMVKVPEAKSDSVKR